MKIDRRNLLGLAAALPFLGKPFAALAQAGVPDFRSWAPTPPMGWNSWDSFGATISELQAREVAAIMARRLRPVGYDVFTIDVEWYEPGANGFLYRKDAPLAMDAWGRLRPAVNRFPSAANGAGFKPLADHLHSMGLKFGIHLLRGVPRQAADRNLPILGTTHTCGEIADRVNICKWNGDMYGIDMSKPGAQAYYDSVFKLIASWDMDFVKVDDLSRPYDRNKPEIDAVRRAIDRSGRKMVLSLSPGPTPLHDASHAADHANMWRISDDFWDKWPLLEAQFQRLADWAPHRKPGAWPDADMLPFGMLELGKRKTNFTVDEQRTVMTLWSIARSPLIMGGDLRKLDAATEALLTNPEIIAVNQASQGGHQLTRANGHVVWTAKAPDNGDSYVALFNLNDQVGKVPVALSALGLGRVRVRDLWRRKWIGGAHDTLSAHVPPHGAELYRLRAV